MHLFLFLYVQHYFSRFGFQRHKKNLRFLDSSKTRICSGFDLKNRKKTRSDNLRKKNPTPFIFPDTRFSFLAQLFVPLGYIPHNWLRAYDAGGIDALRAKPVPGRPSRVTDDQLDWVRAIILETSPLDWRFETTLWTRRMVVEMIESLYGVSYSEESAGRLMRQKMGLSPQRPVRRAAEQDPEAVRRWLVEEYPTIAAQARDEGAQIYFGDEASVRSDHHSGTTWGAQGETPVIEKTGKRFGMNLISAISAQGTMRYMEVNGRMNAERFIEFLKRLINTHDQPVYFIVDGHPSHKAKKVLTFVERNKKKLKLFFLPAYSPQLNPDELVWNQLKNHHTGKRAIKTITELKKIVHSAMRSIQRSPDLIRSFFGETQVKYARE